MRGIETEGYYADDRGFVIEVFSYDEREGEVWYYRVWEPCEGGSTLAQVIPQHPGKFRGRWPSRQEVIEAAKGAIDAYVGQQPARPS